MHDAGEISTWKVALVSRTFYYALVVRQDEDFDRAGINDDDNGDDDVADGKTCSSDVNDKEKRVSVEFQDLPKVKTSD